MGSNSTTEEYKIFLERALADLHLQRRCFNTAQFSQDLAEHFVENLGAAHFEELGDDPILLKEEIEKMFPIIENSAADQEFLQLISEKIIGGGVTLAELDSHSLKLGVLRL